MNKLLTMAVLTVMVAFGANGAWADGPFPAAMTNGTYGPVGSVTPNSNTGEFEIYNAINLLLNTSYTNNAQVDYLEFTGNANTWSQTGPGGYAVIGLGAGATNSLEVYNVLTPGTLINPIGTGFTGNGPVGLGTIGSPYVGSGSIFTSGNLYGFLLNENFHSVNTQWYSNPSMNPDGYDHMLAYNLPSLSGSQVYVYDPNTNSEQLVMLHNPYVLAFEDNPLDSADKDFNDLIVMVDGVAPVPEPMTVALFAVGLLAMVMGGFLMRRKFALPFAIA